MRLTIKIDMDNAAFEDAPEEEVSRILQEWINRGASWPVNLRDVNGNTVGDVKEKRRA